MLLVIDAGNTNVVFGIFKGDKLIKNFRMATVSAFTADEYGLFMHNMLKFYELSPIIEGAVIASVVLKSSAPLKEAIKKYFNVKPVIVDANLGMDFVNKCDNPEELGPDRIANSVAAYELYRKAVIVVDFGTATCLSAINSNGEFLGGAICPGINVSLEALAKRTSMLPRIEIGKPQKAIGTNTIDNIKSGVFLGHIGQVEYLIRKMKEEINDKDIMVVATGGLAKLIASQTQEINETKEFLTLEGLKIIYNKVHKIVEADVEVWEGE